MQELNQKQKRFCDEYLIDLNATQAAIRAGYSKKTARQTGMENLTKPYIQKYIQERIKNREQRTEITQDKVIQELAAIAFSNGTDFARVIEKSNDEGHKWKEVEVINTDDLPEEKKKAIAAIKETKFGINIETCDKVKALELIGKHLGIFKDKIELSGNINNPYAGLTTEELKKLIDNG